MSLPAALARISAIDAALLPPAPAPASTSAPSATPSTSFAGALQGAMATAASGQAAALGQTAAPTPTLGGSANPMVSIAEGEVGQAEQPPGSNDSPRIAAYRSATVGAAAGEPWCAYFVSWVARQAGTPIGDQGQGLGYVGDIWSWAQRTGRAVPNGPGVVPRPGDLIVFGDHHVGIVETVLPDGHIQTIEGNYSNQVSRVNRAPDEATGYVRMS